MSNSIIKDNLLYTEDHEWVEVNGNEAKIGITDHAQHQLGDIVFVDLPDEGDEIDKGDEFAAIESTKAASDSFMPISGKIIAVNEDLDDAPESINEDPYKNFIIKVEISDKSELDGLMDAAKYKEFLENLEG